MKGLVVLVRCVCQPGATVDKSTKISCAAIEDKKRTVASYTPPRMAPRPLNAGWLFLVVRTHVAAGSIARSMLAKSLVTGRMFFRPIARVHLISCHTVPVERRLYIGYLALLD